MRRGLFDRDVTLQTRHFVVVYVLPHFSAKLRHRVVGAVFLELVQHTGPETWNGQDVRIARGVQVERHEHILFETRQLGVVHLLGNFPVKLGERRVGTVFIELVRHARSRAGNKQDLLSRGRVEVHMHEESTIKLRHLRSVECPRQ